MIGKTVSHYKIISKLGEGGMGVVYKANDTRLDRHVAIKFLPPQLSSDDSAKKRFIREAKAASALNHANIAVVHEIDETPEGQTFMVMACYEGQTLKDRLENGALGVDEAIEIVSQIVSGLAKAHEKGIVHRDIKPGNIFIGEDGQAKLADFGLATLAGQTKITRSGTTVGTISYMSPEQARGEEVDHQSDIFSLGVVLFELLTGKLPFPGDHEAAVLYGIVNGDPKLLTQYNQNLPAALQGVLDKSLAKEKRDRYASVAELEIDLRRIAGDHHHSDSPGSASSDRRRKTEKVLWPLALKLGIPIVLTAVAVFILFRNPWHSSQPASLRVALFDFSLLADQPDPVSIAGLMAAIQVGLADADQYTLVSPEYLRDIQRRKLQLTGESIPAAQMIQIAREADASHLVTGEVIKNAEAAQVTWRLIETKQGKVVTAGKINKDEWSDQADTVVQDVAHALLGMTNASADTPVLTVAEMISADEEAYRYYAASLVAKEDGHFENAREDLLRAVEIDTTFALAYFELSRNYDPNTEAHQAQQAAGKAWQLRAHLGRKERMLLEAHRLYLDYKVGQAVNAYDEVLSIWPDDKEALVGRASTQFYFRSWNEAKKSAQEGLHFYPNEPRLLQLLAAALSQLGDWDRALEVAKLASMRRAGAIDAIGTLGDIYLRMGMPDSAAAAYKRALALETRDFNSAVGLSLCEYERGNLDGAIRIQEELLRDSLYTEASRGILRYPSFLLVLPSLYADAGRLQEAGNILEASSFYGYVDVLLYAAVPNRALPMLPEQPQRAQRRGAKEAILMSMYLEAICMVRVGEIEKAEKLYDSIVRKVQADSDLPRGFYQRNLELAAIVAVAKGQPDAALNHLDDLFDEGFMRICPDEIRILETRAEAYAEAGDFSRAITSYEDLVRVYGGRSLAHLRLAELLDRTGRKEEARREYSKCVTLWSQADVDYPYPSRARAGLAALE